MQFTAKQDLPNLAGSPSVNNLTDENLKRESLFNDISRSTSGNVSYTSTTSGIVYNTSDFPSDPTIFNQGENGLLQLITNSLANNLYTADEINDVYIQEVTSEKTYQASAFTTGDSDTADVEGFINSGTMNGLTIDQFVDNTNDFANWTTSDFTVSNGRQVYTADAATSIVGIASTTLENNTLYTVVSLVFSNNLTTDFRQLVGSDLGISTITISPGSGDGIFATAFTTGTISNNRLRQFVTNTETSGNEIEVKTIILQGDWTGYDDTFLTQLVLGADFGLYSVKNLRLTSVGKNLFNKNAVTYGYQVDNTDGDDTASTGETASEYIPIEESLSYYISGCTSTTNTDGAYYDSGQNYISGFTSYGALTIPINTAFVRFTADEDDLETAQLEIGTSATDYESYKSSILTANTDLKSVPLTTVEDTVDLKTGINIVRVNVGTLGNGVTINTTNLPDALEDGQFYFKQDDGFVVTGIVDGSTVTADTGSIYYELAEPKVIDLSSEGSFTGQYLAYPNGTTYLESDSGVIPEIQVVYGINPASTRIENSQSIANLGKQIGVKYKARIYSDSNQSISNSTDTAIIFNSVRWDIGNFFDKDNPTRLTIPEGGHYIVNVGIEFQSFGTADGRVQIRLNGTTIIAWNSKNEEYNFAFGTDYEFEKDDYIEVIVRQTSGGARDVQASGNYSPEFSIVKV